MPDILVELYDRMGWVGSVITGLIILFFICGFYINILIRRRYLSLSEELAAFCGGKIKELRSDMLIWITEEYKAVLDSGAGSINTGAVIDTAIEAYQKPCILGEGYLKKVNGLLITTGLFGTFIGLTSAVGNIGMTMNQTETILAESGITLFRILTSSFEDLSAAFITSLFGTGLSILLSVLTVFSGAGEAKKLFITQLEEYLDIKLISEAEEPGTKQGPNGTDEINILSQVLKDSLNFFNQTVYDYAEALQSLKDFNNEFKHNLENAGKSVPALCQSLDKASETACQSEKSIVTCSETLAGLVREMDDETLRLEGMNEILAGLSKKLDESSQDRKIFLRVIDEIPDRLLNYSEAAVARAERGG